MTKLYTLIFILILGTGNLLGQVGIGFTITNDIYQRYNNPADGLAGTSAGSLIMNLGIGPKIWIGGNDVSISLDATANLGVFGIDLNDYKGMGMVAFPIMAHLNFGGLSGLDKEGKFGLTFGGGIQYNKTELYYLKNEDEDNGVKRDLFKTIVAEIGYGFGMTGFTIHPFIRYGWDPDGSANSFNFGIRYDFNIPKLKEISNPESEL